jgi:hypothetical protein
MDLHSAIFNFIIFCILSITDTTESQTHQWEINYQHCSPGLPLVAKCDQEKSLYQFYPHKGCDSMTVVDLPITKIFTNGYQKELIPAWDQSKPMDLYFQMIPLNLNSFSEIEETISMIMN